MHKRDRGQRSSAGHACSHAERDDQPPVLEDVKGGMRSSGSRYAPVRLRAWLHSAPLHPLTCTAALLCHTCCGAQVCSLRGELSSVGCMHALRSPRSMSSAGSRLACGDADGCCARLWRCAACRRTRASKLSPGLYGIWTACGRPPRHSHLSICGNPQPAIQAHSNLPFPYLRFVWQGTRILPCRRRRMLHCSVQGTQ